MNRRQVAALATAAMLWACGSGTGSGGDALTDTGPEDLRTAGEVSDLSEADALLLDMVEAEIPVVIPDCNGESVLAVMHVSVLPMTSDAVLEDQTVIVADGRICFVGPPSGVLLPLNTQIVDGTGRFLMPGLTDMHIHLNFQTDLLLYVANGVTAVRNMWGTAWTLELQQKIKSREILGPELFTSGPIMDGDPPDWEGSEVVTTPEEAMTSIEQQVAAGYQFIKVYNNLDLDVYDAIIESAGGHGLPVVGHVPYNVGLEHVLQSGQYSLEHLIGYDLFDSDGNLEALTAELGVWNCPTLVVYDKYRQVDELHETGVEGQEYVHPQTRAWWKTSGTYLPYAMKALLAKTEELHDLGAPLLAGSDATNPYVVPGFSLHEEMKLLVQAGLSPHDVLTSATVGPAENLGVDQRAGTVELGKDADLILLEDNPLLDISATRSIVGVLIKGQWYTAIELQTLLDDLAEQFQEQYSLDFDCVLPEQYDQPPVGDHALFKLKGDIAGFGEDCAAGHEFEVVVNGSEMDVDGFSSCANSQFFYTGDHVGLYAFSAAEYLGPEHLAYNYFSVSIPKYALQLLKESGEYEIQAEPDQVFVANMESKTSGADAMYKLCPVAVAAPDSPESTLFICHDGNETFAHGENLQIAGSILLSTDPETIKNAMLTDEDCSCWKNKYEDLTCQEFEAK